MMSTCRFLPKGRPRVLVVELRAQKWSRVDRYVGVGGGDGDVVMVVFVVVMVVVLVVDWWCYYY